MGTSSSQFLPLQLREYFERGGQIICSFEDQFLEFFAYFGDQQRTTFKSWFSPLVMWVLAILKSGYQAWQPLPLPAEPSHWCSFPSFKAH